MNMRRIVSDEELSASMLAELDLLRSQYVGKFVYFTFPNPSFDCDSEFRIRSERSVERQELLFVLELVATKPNSRVSPCIWPMPMRVLREKLRREEPQLFDDQGCFRENVVAIPTEIGIFNSELLSGDKARNLLSASHSNNRQFEVTDP